MKNKKKIILIAVIAAVLLCAAGVCAAVLLKPQPVDKEPEPEKPAVENEVKEEVKEEVADYDNHVERKAFTVDKVLLDNDFSKTLDLTVTEKYHKSSFFGCKAELEDGWAHLTSDNHLFVFGWHTWGAYGGIQFETGKTYTMSFDLKKGSENGNDIFVLNLAEEKEGEDPRYGDQLKQVVLDFSDIENMCSFNSDRGTFAAVQYTGETGICHVEIRFTVDRGANNYLVNCHDSTTLNDWLIDNLYIAEITEEGSDFEWIVEDTKPTYSCNINPRSNDYYVRFVLLDEKFNTADSLKLENGGRNAFFGPTKMTLDKNAARLTTGQHLFTFGRFNAWGNNFGGVEFEKDHQYLMSFDLKLGDARTQKVFNLYIMQEDDPDPRFGSVLNTLKLDFNDLYLEKKSGQTDYFVKENTNQFASVKYDSKTRTAHIEIRFTRTVEPDIQVVSKGTGDNEWVLDNIYVADITPPVNVTKYDYTNGISLDQYVSKNEVFYNDFSEDVNKGVIKSWHKSAFFGSEAVLDGGAARLTSKEHLFTYGPHTWGFYGGLSLAKGATYKMSFDLKLGDNDANRTFNLYVMSENGDPRFSNVEKTLTLNYMDYKNLVTQNTNNFASVTYSSSSDWAHIEIVFTTDKNQNTEIVSRCRGTNNWLIDNVKFEEVSLVCQEHVDNNGDGICDSCGRKIIAEKDYFNGIDFANYETVSTLFENDFEENVDKGVTKEWEKSAFFGSTASLSAGSARITSDEHVFVYGGHSWGNYGSVSMAKDTMYKASFDLKLGDEDATHIFNLYVTKENGDPRYGDVMKTLTLNFADFNHFVTVNTDNFASVRYTAATHTAHIEVLFKSDAEKKTLLAAHQAGLNDWFVDNLKIEQVTFVCNEHKDDNHDGYCDICGREIIGEKDYDNGVTLANTSVVSIAYENDFSEDANKGVTQPWHKSPYFGSAVALKDGQVQITSDEHVFVYGGHTYGNYGGMSFEKDTWYKTSFDIQLGSQDANKMFTLYVMTENGDPRFGNIVGTLTLDFSDFENFVTENTGNFAHVTYDAASHTAHVEALFKTDADAKTQLVSRKEGSNNWLMDNLQIAKVKLECTTCVDEDGDGLCDVCGKAIVSEEDYDNEVFLDDYKVTVQKFNNDFETDVNLGVTAAWHKSAFVDSTAVLEDGWAKITSNQHVFTYGGHSWGLYGGLSMKKNQMYKVAFDLKLGSEDANKTFNLYVMTEKAGSDPRFGDVLKTLTLNFGDYKNFVVTNTDDFAHVTYSKSTHIAHVEMVFATDAEKNTLLVSKLEEEDKTNSNNWLLDNLTIDEVEKTFAYDNGVDFSDYTVVSTKFENDFSESATKGVTAAWHKSSFYDSTAVLEEGWARVTSSEHVFVYGGHSWGNYGGFSLDANKTYRTSFDLKLGSEDANKIFNLYVMTENGDPRFGDIVKTLTLDLSDLENMVTINTDNFASVKYEGQTKTVHIEVLYQTDASKKTDLVSKSVGTNNWLIDNLKFEEVKEP